MSISAELAIGLLSGVKGGFDKLDSTIKGKVNDSVVKTFRSLNIPCVILKEDNFIYPIDTESGDISSKSEFDAIVRNIISDGFVKLKVFEDDERCRYVCTDSIKEFTLGYRVPTEGFFVRMSNNLRITFGLDTNNFSNTNANTNTSNMSNSNAFGNTP